MDTFQDHHGSLADRRTASFYTPQQRRALEDYFVSSSSSNFRTRKESQKKLEELSFFTGLSKDQIRMWLRNRKKRGAYKGKIVYDVEQVRVLEWLFTNYSNYPSSHLKNSVAEYLDMSYAQIQKWFQTRRQRGVPALLSYHAKDEETWQQTLKHVHYLIEKSKNEDSSEGDMDNPVKRRKLDDDRPIQTTPQQSLIHHSPEFSPSDGVQDRFPRTISTLPILMAAESALSSRCSNSNNECRNESQLPSLREVLQGISSQTNWFATVHSAPSHPYFPFASSMPTIFTSQTNTPFRQSPSFSITSFLQSDEKSFVLPPLQILHPILEETVSFPC